MGLSCLHHLEHIRVGSACLATGLNSLRLGAVYSDVSNYCVKNPCLIYSDQRVSDLR